MKNPKYIIGIDLGTTNSTLSFMSLDNGVGKPKIELFSIPQVVQAGTQKGDYSLPSFIYYPFQEELDKHLAGIQWDPKRTFSLGIYARERSAEVPTRVVSSAKSWLCHTGIDRRESFLPLDSEDQKTSPIMACAEILRHLREAWDQEKGETPFVDQSILITVPASFDPGARQLVQEAAKIAEYPEIVLLEEPQAAFYAWLHHNHDNWRETLKINDTILVIDIGGGTTDFSLIGVEEDHKNLSLRRKAVGSHLLLGGDNIDLALAYLVKGKLEDQGHEIDSWQFQGLIHQCRKSKETLLEENGPQSVDIILLGRGSRLIGNTLKAELTLEETKKLLLDGFIPLLPPEEQSPRESKGGIQQIGLPFVQDPRISCQLAKFLSMSGESANGTIHNFEIPTAVLFNGGTMKSSSLRQQLMTLLNQWAVKLNKPLVRELSDADYDFGVSKGAVYYGLARRGQAIRIKGGTSHSYYVGVEEAAPAVPGLSPPLRAICIVPFGMEEGEEKELSNQEFALVLGEKANFRFFSHGTPHLSSGVEPQIGTMLRQWKQELTELHPIETILEKQEQEGKTVRVKLKSKVTELGFLELWCEAPNGNKWKLEFDIRNKK